MKRLSLRRWLAGACLANAAWAAVFSASGLRTALSGLEATSKGRLGLAFLDPGTGRHFAYRGDERFPLCSTFKLFLVAAVLRQSQASPPLLEKTIAYQAADLLSWAPVTRKHLDTGLTVAQLCAAALQSSDNTAANLLLRELGGPRAVNALAQSIGDPAFRLDRIEPELNESRPGDPRDTTTPQAMAASVRAIVLGHVLSPGHRAQLTAWIKGNTTGQASIRAGVPADWRVGDKTGGGDYGTTNDVAVLWPPKGGPLVLVVYFTQDTQDAPSRRDVLATSTRLVLRHFFPQTAFPQK